MSPRMGSLRQGYVLVSSFLPCTGGQGSEQRHFNNQTEGQDSLRQDIMYDYNNKSNEKQVKETVSDGVRIDFSLQQKKADTLRWTLRVRRHNMV